jgi:predicted enzyme related to lactoylglutathione lyase
VGLDGGGRPEKTGPRLLVQRVPGGKTAKNRMHLDDNASKPHGHTDQGWRQVEEHVRSLTAAGATVIREVNEVTGRCIVLQDPEGNEFCVQ